MRGDSTAFGHDGRVDLPPTHLIKSVCVPPICYPHSVSPTASIAAGYIGLAGYYTLLLF